MRQTFGFSTLGPSDAPNFWISTLGPSAAANLWFFDPRALGWHNNCKNMELRFLHKHCLPPILVGAEGSPFFMLY